MMYESVILDSFSNSEIYKLSLYADPESSETTLTESEDSTDTSEEVNENDDVIEYGTEDNDDVPDPEVSEGTSGSDLSMDHTGDFGDMFHDRWSDSETQADEEDPARSDFSADTEAEDPEEYEIVIHGDRESITELYRTLNGELEDDEDDFDDIFESQFDNESEESYEDDGEFEESGEESEGSFYSSEIGTAESTGFESDSIEFYNRNLELLGIIAGCLFFIVFTLICKYIYKFFRLFI